jgi:hypothetical protein
MIIFTIKEIFHDFSWQVVIFTLPELLIAGGCGKSMIHGKWREVLQYALLIFIVQLVTFMRFWMKVRYEIRNGKTWIVLEPYSVFVPAGVTLKKIYNNYIHLTDLFRSFYSIRLPYILYISYKCETWKRDNQPWLPSRAAWKKRENVKKTWKRENERENVKTSTTARDTLYSLYNKIVEN